VWDHCEKPLSLVEVLAVIGSILAPVAGVATLYVNRLREQDKLRFDAKLGFLKRQISRCQEDYEGSSKCLEEERRRREKAEVAVSRMEGEIKSFERENQELRIENRDLRERLYGTKPK